MKLYILNADAPETWGNEAYNGMAISEEELNRLSSEWGTPISELMKDLEPIDTSDDVLTESEAYEIYKTLQQMYTEACEIESDEERFKTLKPISDEMDRLFPAVHDDLLSDDGIYDVHESTSNILLKTLEFVYEDKVLCVDITLNTDSEEYGAWLYGYNTGIKTYMFGSYVNSTRFGQPVTETLRSFTDTVLRNLPEYVPDYVEDYLL